MSHIIRFLLVFLAIILLNNLVFAAPMATDPSRLTPSARTLGMGKAFVGLADDVAAIYSNPAGLASLDNWQLTSLSGNFLQEVNYLSAAGVYPTEYGAIGFGFVGTNIGGAYVTTIEANSDPRDPVYIIDTSAGTMSNYNNVFHLSYATKLGRFIKNTNWAEKISLGANWKIYSFGLTGGRIGNGDGTATGTELDLGLLASVNEWCSLGITLQNALPYSMGGKLSYASGHTESYPALLKIGTKFNLIGERNSLYKLGTQDVKLLLDFDTYPTINYPTTSHLGAEWKPHKMVALRMGFDQEGVGNGYGTGMVTKTNLTSGVGLYIGNFRFDVAYHQFISAPGMDNYFFSLSYIPQEVKNPLVVETPKDKSIVFDIYANVTGIANDQNIKSLAISNIPVQLDPRGKFAVKLDLKTGKNALIIAGLDSGLKTIASEKIRILRLIKFPDVSTDYWVAKPISLLAMQNIITGYPDKTFKPEGNITRAEMCTLLMKSKTGIKDNLIGSNAKAVKFSDVGSRHWAANHIDQAAKLGVVKGYPDGSFKPKANITRAEGLAMIVRFAGIEKLVYNTEFSDVNKKHWAASTISGAKKAGLLKYLKSKNFKPNKKLTRAETVEMLYKTQYIQKLLAEDLLNWGTY